MDPARHARVLSEKADAFYEGVRLNPLAVYCAVRTAIEALNVQRTSDGLPAIKAPSESTVRRYLQRHLDYGRANPPLWLARRRPALRPDPRLGAGGAHPGHGGGGPDAHRGVDCAVIDDEHMINVGRPWLAVMIDVKSRYPLGFHLSFEPPSVETVLACLRHAVRPKTQLAQGASRGERRVAGLWACRTRWWWTTPGRTPAARCATPAPTPNISLVYAPVATPEYKGVCERFFGTLNTLLFHRLPGGLPFTPQQRKQLGIGGEGDRRAPAQRRAPRHPPVHRRGLRARVPQGAAGLARAGLAQGRPEPRPRICRRPAGARPGPGQARAVRPHAQPRGPHPPRLDLQHAPRCSAAYWPTCCRGKPPAVRGPGTARVKVKYHPEDLGQVYVWNEVRRRYDTLVCTQPDYACGLSEHHHKLIRAHAKAEHPRFPERGGEVRRTGAAAGPRHPSDPAVEGRATDGGCSG